MQIYWINLIFIDLKNPGEKPSGLLILNMFIDVKKSILFF